MLRESNGKFLAILGMQSELRKNRALPRKKPSKREDHKKVFMEIYRRRLIVLKVNADLMNISFF